MLNFKFCHSVSNIFVDPDKSLPSINQDDEDLFYQDSGITIDPKKCRCAHVSTDGYSIIYQKEKGQVIFHKFVYAPSISVKLYEGPIDDDDSIKEAYLSSNEQFFSFTTFKGYGYLINLKTRSNSKRANIVKIQDLTHFIPVFSTSNSTYCLFERSDSLFYISPISTADPDFTNLCSRRFSKLIISDIKWWSIFSPSHHIAGITSDSKLHIFFLQHKPIEIYSSIFNQFIPTHFYVIGQSKFVFLLITSLKVEFYVIFKDSDYKTITKDFRFGCNLPISQIKVILFDSVIAISAPKSHLIFFDTIDYTFYDITNKNQILDFRTPDCLFDCSLSWNLFFGVAELAFYELEIFPSLLANLLPEAKLMVAHMIGAHPPFNREREQTILKASSILNPFEFYDFLLEYIISSTWLCLKNNILNNWSQIFSSSKLQQQNFSEISQIFTKFQLHTSKHIAGIYEDEIDQSSLDKFSEISKEKNLIEVLSPLIKKSTVNLDKLDISYSPYMFWKRSTILLALFLLITQKPLKSKLIYCRHPLLLYYNQMPDDKKSKPSYSEPSVTNYLKLLNKVEKQISDDLAVPKDNQFPLLSIHYLISKRFHFPFFIEKITFIQDLAIRYLSKTICQMLSKFGLFQKFDILNFDKDHLDDEMQLWLNSPSASKAVSPQLKSEFIYHWPTRKRYGDSDNSCSPNSKNTVFGPYVQYEKWTTGFVDDDPYYQSMVKREEEYSFDNLFRIYS